MNTNELEGNSESDLESEEGKAIKQLLEEDINPRVALHGGYIELVSVRDGTAYIRMEGRCQGCGMVNVTLTQGVTKAIQAQVPTVTRVHDVTNHAEGTNPYYEPGKGGTSVP
jgi:Fe-S cluster biogenesis protein NfuA